MILHHRDEKAVHDLDVIDISHRMNKDEKGDNGDAGVWHVGKHTNALHRLITALSLSNPSKAYWD